MNLAHRCSLVLALASGSALAEDAPRDKTPEGASVEEIEGMLADENAKYKLDAILQAIKETEHPFRARDVYALLDLGATPEMTLLAASKAQIFWDGTARPLPQIVTAGRESAPAKTIEISSNEGLVVVFETFNDIMYGMEAARKQVGELAPRQPHEDDNKVDLRIRERDVALAEGLSPYEGRIDKLTFQAELSGTYTQHDGKCTKAIVNVDLSNVSLDLFRYTLGGRKVEAVLDLGLKTNVESAKFSASGRYRFEAHSRPICISAAQFDALLQQGSKLVITFGRPHDSDKWTGTGAFYNAKTNKKL